MATQPMRTVCDLMARAIKHIQQEIKAKQGRVRNLSERLKKLESQPNPDKAQIAEIRGDIQELEGELKTDLSQLNAFQEEHAASCGP